MTLINHELRRGRLSLCVWTAGIAVIMVVCVLLYPEVKGQTDAMNAMFSSMGSFTDAFGMDELNFGTLIGFYAVECGNVLGLGGAFFAALLGISALSKEEGEGTAEFLLTQPVSRCKVVSCKLIHILIQLTVLSAIVYLVCIVSIFGIGEEIPWKELNLIHIGYYLLQIEISAICFGISVFLRKSSMGIGLGVGMILYFMNLIANITENAEFLKYLTPFGFADGADIVAKGKLNGIMVAIGLGIAVTAVAIAYGKYSRKDIQ